MPRYRVTRALEFAEDGTVTKESETIFPGINAALDEFDRLVQGGDVTFLDAAVSRKMYREIMGAECGAIKVTDWFAREIPMLRKRYRYEVDLFCSEDGSKDDTLRMFKELDSAKSFCEKTAREERRRCDIYDYCSFLKARSTQPQWIFTPPENDK